MKNWLHNGLLVLGLALAAGCSNHSANDKVAESPQPVKTQLNGSADGYYTSVKVPLDSAAPNVRAYDSICRKLFKTVPVKGFTIRARDLLEALGMPVSDTLECRYSHARVYLGLDRDSQFKLYFVPVDGANLSMDIGGTDVPVIDPKAEGQKSVLDLNTPCPKVCAENNIFAPAR